MTNPTKTDYNVLCYGNNNIPSSEFSYFYMKHMEEKLRNFPSRISLYSAPDLDLFNRFEDPVYTPEVRELIEQGEIDVFLILISLEGAFSQSMYNLLTSIPTNLGLNEESFWKKAVIAFDTKERPDPKQYIERSIERNIAIKRMVEKVGGRYTYLSQSEFDVAFYNLVTHPQEQRNDGIFRKGLNSIQSAVGSLFRFLGRSVTNHRTAISCVVVCSSVVIGVYCLSKTISYLYKCY